MLGSFIKWFLISVSVLGLLLSVLIAWFFKSKDIHILLTSNVPEEIHANLAWDNTLNLEQTYNACGPYATMAYAFVKAGVKMDPEKINLQIGGRHGDGLTFPWGISAYLNQHNIEAHIYYMGFLTKRQRLEWLKKKIDNGHPVIEMIGTSEWAHYVTILGYTGNILHKYDSYFSKDENGEEIGNSSAEADYIINLSETVSFHGLPTHLAISY
ncbi:MAG: hypothetical protein U1F46_03995 [Marinagarivorans sp.]